MYEDLKKEPGPKVLKEALKLYGIKEIKGPTHNEAIMDWADELGIEKTFQNDETAWCGLFAAIVVKRAGFDVVDGPLWALNWNKFGTREYEAKLGDILTFKRKSGGHVGIYVGEDSACYHVLGGNQADMVNIIRIEKGRLSQIRRCPWRVAQPDNVRKIKRSAVGEISENEA